MKNTLIMVFAIVLLLATNSVTGQETIHQQVSEFMVNGVLKPYAFSAQSVHGGYKCAFVDMDNDGDMDMVRRVSQYDINFYRNIGTPNEPFWSWEPDFFNDLDLVSRADSPTFRDLDGDGDEELILGDSYNGGNKGYVYVYQNTGTPENAIFANQPDTLKYMAYNGEQTYIDAWDHSSPVLEDLDIDGDYDLILGKGYGSIAYFENIGTPYQAVWDSVSDTYFDIDVGYKSAPDFADVDGDGYPEMFIGNDNNRIYHYKNVASTPDTVIWELISSQFICLGQTSGGGRYVFPCFVDIDGDGDQDLFVLSTERRLF